MYLLPPIFVSEDGSWFPPLPTEVSDGRELGLIDHRECVSGCGAYQTKGSAAIPLEMLEWWYFPKQGLSICSLEEWSRRYNQGSRKGKSGQREIPKAGYCCEKGTQFQWGPSGETRWNKLSTVPLKSRMGHFPISPICVTDKASRALNILSPSMACVYSLVSSCDRHEQRPL